MLESKVFIVSEIDPMFFMLKALRMGLLPGQRLFQTLYQIIDNVMGIQDSDYSKYGNSPYKPILKSMESSALPAWNN